MSLPQVLLQVVVVLRIVLLHDLFQVHGAIDLLGNLASGARDATYAVLQVRQGHNLPGRVLCELYRLMLLASIEHQMSQ